MAISNILIDSYQAVRMYHDRNIVWERNKNEPIRYVKYEDLMAMSIGSTKRVYLCSINTTTSSTAQNAIRGKMGTMYGFFKGTLKSFDEIEETFKDTIMNKKSVRDSNDYIWVITRTSDGFTMKTVSGGDFNLTYFKTLEFEKVSESPIDINNVPGLTFAKVKEIFVKIAANVSGYRTYLRSGNNSNAGFSGGSDNGYFETCWLLYEII